jgi:hypothetical protein
MTGVASPPGLARSRSTMAAEASMPWTSTPLAARGRATLPVPMPSSSAGPGAGQLGQPVDAVRRVGHGRRHGVVQVGDPVAVGLGS